MLGGVLNLSAGVAGGQWVLPFTCSRGRVSLRPGPLLPLMPLGAHTWALPSAFSTTHFSSALQQPQDTGCRVCTPILQKIKLRHREVK